MISRLTATILVLSVLVAPCRITHGAVQSESIVVDASELDRRGDLVGKLIRVDDRVRFYQSHRGEGYDEVYLKRTHVKFRLPPRLRPEVAPRPMPVVVEGRLIRDGGELVCEVESLKVMPNDLERLDQAIAALSAKDFENRKAWAAWAEKRGKSFKPEDKPLIQRARSLQAEALRLEADRKQVAVDAPEEWLTLAEQGRRRGIPEPDPSALAHKAFQAKLAAAGIEDIKGIIAAIEKFFPQAASDLAAGRIPLGRWNQAYRDDPAGAYRAAPANLRAALDRRLYADAVERLWEKQVALDPARGLALAPQAEAELPERTDLPPKLLTKGLEAARRNLSSLLLGELKTIGQTFRDKLKNPQAALELYRDWLKLKRDRLSDTDAEGRLVLAGLYEDLLQDRAVAIDLLQKAWKIDPGSKEVAEALRSRGFRLVKDEWLASTPETDTTSAASPQGDRQTRTPLETSQGLRGKTPEEVTMKLGVKPNSKVFAGTKGQLIEQWIFKESATKTHYVTFLRTPGDLKPRVIGDYFLTVRRP